MPTHTSLLTRRALRALSAILLLGLSGCAALGPDSLRGTRLDYNLAIQETNDQELLLNLVRLKYRDRPYFLNVERVVSALEVNRSLAGALSRPPTVDPTLTLGPVSFGYNEKPSVFYTPLEGDRFVRQMLTPIPLDSILLLTRSGWSIERVFMLAIQEMNGLKNAPSASGPTPNAEPEYREYREAVGALRALQVKGLVELGRADAQTYELRLAEHSAGDPDAQRLRALLRLDPALNRYALRVGIRAPDARADVGREIAVTPRAMSAVLYYLSQGVAVPAIDRAAGRVTRTRAADGAEFDWHALLHGVLRIDAAQDKPENAAVAVAYRGHWFYIRDDDLDSKSSFSLLAQLLTLQAGAPPAAGASLSFSVGQ